MLSSLLNLTAQLGFQRDRSQLLVKGIAEDLNFAEYRLEYARVGSGLQWSPIGVPSDTPVVNDLLGAWIPPAEGSYYVRLTGTDQAGNEASAIASMEVVRRNLTAGDAALDTVVKIRPADKLKALELLGKHLAMFIDRSEVKMTTDVKRLSTPELAARVRTILDGLEGKAP